MAMTYNSLTAAKGTAGSVATWVGYSKLDVATIVDEAQALIYSGLRTREMLADYAFSMPAGGAHIALPARFLDLIGRIRCVTSNIPIRHKDASFIKDTRSYSETSGALASNALTTTNGSTTVSVGLTGHNLTQDSIFTIAGAAAFNGVTINGTFPVAGITDANNFTIDISILGQTPTASGAGGGAAMTYIADVLASGSPTWFGIWNERIYFDVACSDQLQCYLHYYQSLPLLSSSNQSNFLTTRYPQLMRTACVAAAADFMKDDAEYQKNFARLTAMVQQVNLENDGFLRGIELDTDTP